MFTPGKQISDFPDASRGATALPVPPPHPMRACVPKWNSLELCL
jgi:hypothetical protein